MRAQFQMSFDLVNAAFEGDDCPIEVARILKDVTAKVECGISDGLIFDVNGNQVGHWAYDPPETDED